MLPKFTLCYFVCIFLLARVKTACAINTVTWMLGLICEQNVTIVPG